MRRNKSSHLPFAIRLQETDVWSVWRPMERGRRGNNTLNFCAHLAVEAVIGEPVSVSEFPVSRENTGKFAA
jgi:hypothetical protein